MKVRAQFEIADTKVDEIAEGNDAEDLIAQAKARVAKHLGWKGIFLNAMTPLAFAQLAVKLYNDRHSSNYPIPQKAEDFVEFGKETGNLVVLEE